ncbi:hypothetical protein DQ04_01301090 [Trypanosoma grayi]|uniref:hypothetical protein n=1 Tax=Trypanosoma grayi TaxID=71804 RepID=UPI0004F49EEA|nr:hypothetical protein DQ04_01301090 [Trypanosoma grayi]KEG12965.1 hypothetical protein DQ04_01301090 [Trypanosoma grayi]
MNGLPTVVPVSTTSGGVSPAATTPCVRVKTTFETLHSFSDLRKALNTLYGGGVDGSQSVSRRNILGFGASTSNRDAVGAGKRLLCVWDVDDTLVSSGTPGVRQCPVFDESELAGLFRGICARHLFLSQGSIDDVMDPGGGGKLQYLVPFFRQDGATNEYAVPSKARAGCCWSSALPDRSRTGARCAAERDAAVVVVRIATLRAPLEKPGDSRMFLSEDVEPPRCPSDVRWLVMRPSLWGISLASLSNFIAPSSHTAFLDGSVFHKMDVVRSLAASGHWDAVFFIDNDLTEVGVVRQGLDIDDFNRMKNVDRLPRFFLADLLLLEVSTMLAERERGRHDAMRKTNGTCVEQSLSDSKERLKECCNNIVSCERLEADELPSMNGYGDATTSPDPRGEEERVVELFVAHLHLDQAKYRRITKVKHNGVAHNEKELWHPTLRTGPVCTDDDYEEMVAEFNVIRGKLLQDLAKSTVDLTPVPGWEPSINAVCYPMYERPQRPPTLRHQYYDVCHQITTNLVEPLTSRSAVSQEYELKKEARNLFRRLIRRQPVIDPLCIVEVASTLFTAYTAERRLPRGIAEMLRKNITALAGS